jgi:hypothetical protein
MMLLLTICNTSCDADNANVIIMIMTAPVQSLFKVTFATDHIRHLILAL